MGGYPRPERTRDPFWRRIDVSASVRDGDSRVIRCRDLVSGQRFSVYVDDGLAVEGAVIASIGAWDPSGWSMISVLRLDMGVGPKLIAVRKEPTVSRLGDRHRFWERFRREMFVLHGPDHGVSQLAAARRANDAAREAKEAARRGDGQLPVTRQEAVIARKKERRAATREKRKAALQARIRVKEKIIAEVESLVDGSDLEKAKDCIAALAQRWKVVGALPQSHENELAARFRNAEIAVHAALMRRAELARRATPASAPRPRRRQIVLDAEALVETHDWALVAARFRELSQLWREAESSEDDAILWRRFQESYLTARADEHRGAVQAKLRLVARVEALRASYKEDPADSDIRYEALRRTWGALGSVRMELESALEGRFNHACEAYLADRGVVPDSTG